MIKSYTKKFENKVVFVSSDSLTEDSLRYKFNSLLELVKDKLKNTKVLFIQVIDKHNEYFKDPFLSRLFNKAEEVYQKNKSICEEIWKFYENKFYGFDFSF